MKVQYAPGDGLLLVGAELILVLPRPDGVDLTALWEAVREGDDVEAVLDQLLRGGLRQLPAFGLLLGDRLLLRGEVDGQVVDQDGVHQVSGADVGTWTEHAHPALSGLVLGWSDGTLPPSLPLQCGVVRAGGLMLGEQPSDPAMAEGLAGVMPTSAAGTAAVALEPAHPEGIATAGPAAAPGSTPPAERAAPSPHQPPREAQSAGEPAESSESAPGGRPSEQTLVVDDEGSPPDVGVGAEAGDAPTDEALTGAVGYDHLWGSTVLRAVGDAAVREPDPEPEPAAATASQAATDSDHDGHTILASELRRLRAEPAAPASPGLVDAVPGREPAHTGPTVPAVRCPAGHLNRPGEATCSRCGADLAGLPALPTPRPALGRLRLADGRVIEVDNTVLIGRSPSAQRVSGPNLPHLVTVDSPEISRLHVEITIEGWDVLVKDRSSNGTVLTRKGGLPQRLHPDDPTLLLPGTRLDLGEGVTADFEAVDA